MHAAASTGNAMTNNGTQGPGRLIRKVTRPPTSATGANPPPLSTSKHPHDSASLFMTPIGLMVVPDKALSTRVSQAAGSLLYYSPFNHPDGTPGRVPLSNVSYPYCLDSHLGLPRLQDYRDNILEARRVEASRLMPRGTPLPAADDTPVQSRRYAGSSTTPLPAAFENRRQRGAEAGEVEANTRGIRRAVIERERRTMTSAARTKQEGKENRVRMLEDELEAMKRALNELRTKQGTSGANIDPSGTLDTVPPIESSVLTVDHPDSDKTRSVIKVTKSIMISREMSAPEIIAHLVGSGCADVTQRLDLNRCGNFPIAGGGFGDIYQGALVCGTRVAIKCPRLFLNNDKQGNETLKNVAREIYAWSKLKHPNVLELIGLSTFRGQISMVSAWMENGTLPCFIVANPGVDRYQLCVQVSAGLAYLHESNIVHGDMKGSNILISDTGIAKLMDFGNAGLKERTLEFTGTTSGSKISLRWAASPLF
ncbi:hypothetical protein FRC08_012336 [Ceratobasidium sp. 394]|nr:hypothetical protein FRC08_012336 [Ceratobasidium sp. 394]